MVAYPHNPTRVPARAHRNVRAGSNSALPVTPPPTPAPRNCVHGNYIDEALLLVDTDGTDGAAAGDRYLGHDHLYSVCVLFAGDGTVLERCEYDACGAVQVMTASYTARVKSLWGNPYFFTGRRWDAANAGTLPIMQHRARTYDPETGRFMQRDMLEYVDGMNLYEYVGSRPVAAADASGKQWHPIERYWYPRIFCWADPEFIEDQIRETIRDLPPIYVAGEGFWFFGGGGITVVSCRDECGQRHCFKYAKVCAGPSLGFGVSTGVVIGMDGRDCRAENYEGVFYELGLSLGPILNIDYGRSPDPEQRVRSIGGMPLPLPNVDVGAKIVLCWYVYLDPNACSPAGGLGLDTLWGCN